MPKLEINLSQTTIDSLTAAAKEQSIEVVDLVQGIATAYGHKHDRQKSMQQLLDRAIANLEGLRKGEIFGISRLFDKSLWSGMAPGFKTALCTKLTQHYLFNQLAGYQGRTDEGRDTYRRI